MKHEFPIIAILRGIKTSEIVDACEALVSAGITQIEVPLNSPDPFRTIELAANHFRGRASIGAGTVLTVAQAEELKAAGGEFVVSPDCNPEVISKTVELGMGSFPGVMTPTEAFAAIRAGATGLKFFPGELVGTKGIKAMRAVLPPQLQVFAVGGAAPDNFKDYLDAGANGFGLGSFLYKVGRPASEIAERAQSAIMAFNEAKNVH